MAVERINLSVPPDVWGSAKASELGLANKQDRLPNLTGWIIEAMRQRLQREERAAARAKALKEATA